MGGAYLSAPAENDVANIAGYIGSDNQVSAEEFVKAVFSCLTLLSSYPELGRRRSFPGAYAGELRSWNVAGFRNYVLFYRLKHENVEVVRVLHGAMDLTGILGDASQAKPDE